MERVIIDTDPGIDDAAAILFALGSGRLRVEMLTTCFGNVDVVQTTRNALAVLEVAGRSDVPVYAGAARPLARQPTYAAYVHGDDGLGDAGVGPPSAAPAPGRAAEQIVRAAMAAPGEITLLALAPLTNVALALALEPRLAGALKRIVVMGGAVRTPGNVTPVATANLYNDPEAGAIVYRSGATIVQAGLDVGRPTVISEAQRQRIAASDSRPAALLSAISGRMVSFYAEAYGEELHYNDVPAVAYVTHPDLFGGRALPVAVETAGTLTAGQTVVDWYGRWGMVPNVEVLLEVDAPRLAAVFTDTIAGQAD
jgi:inosine-uridine nucleoside N-ribohydrolase